MNCSILSRKLICLQHNRLIFKVINQRMHARAFKFLKVCFVSTKISLQILCLLFICIHKLNFIVEFFPKRLDASKSIHHNKDRFGFYLYTMILLQLHNRSKYHLWTLKYLYNFCKVSESNTCKVFIYFL